MEEFKLQGHKSCAGISCGAKLKEAEKYTLKDWLFSLFYTAAIVSLLTCLFNSLLKS